MLEDFEGFTIMIYDEVTIVDVKGTIQVMPKSMHALGKISEIKPASNNDIPHSMWEGHAEISWDDKCRYYIYPITFLSKFATNKWHQLITLFAAITIFSIMFGSKGAYVILIGAIIFYGLLKIGVLYDKHSSRMVWYKPEKEQFAFVDWNNETIIFPDIRDVDEYDDIIDDNFGEVIVLKPIIQKYGSPLKIHDDIHLAAENKALKDEIMMLNSALTAMKLRHIEGNTNGGRGDRATI